MENNAVTEYEDKVDEMTEVAFQIIMHAGDARIASEEALKALHTFDFEAAKKKVDESFDCLLQAHQIQTDLIQKEAAGEKYEISLIFNHAQDTLMTSMTQCRLTRELCTLYELLYDRIEEKGGQSEQRI